MKPGFRSFSSSSRREPHLAAPVPLGLPAEGRQIVQGTMLKAIQLALDDFLPWKVKHHRGATPLEECLSKRESYDVRGWHLLAGRQ